MKRKSLAALSPAVHDRPRIRLRVVVRGQRDGSQGVLPHVVVVHEAVPRLLRWAVFRLVRLVYTSKGGKSMAETYSTYEAKTKFSEILRKVRSGQRVVIAYRGEEVAEIRPLETKGNRLDKSLRRLEDQGLLSRARTPTGPLKPLGRRRGALARFLDARE